MTHESIEGRLFTVAAEGHSFQVSVNQATPTTWAWRAVATDGWKIFSGVADAEALEAASLRAAQDVAHLARECTARGE
jgi:hypothetical protein